jgi:secernin
MCDTILATPGTSAERSMLFGKNSDRQRNEAQTVELKPCAEYARDTEVRCTYISIPQLTRTSAVLLCRPYWIWGAEMGANEHGVVIGNEGLHAKGPPPKEPALTGMDLLRLTLERAQTAREAVDVLTALLAKYGQGGNCGHLTPNYYHNGYMIADATEAFVLETVGRDWLVNSVHGGRSMSNAYTIPQYASTIAAPDREHIGHAGARCVRSTALLREHEGRLTARTFMRILRDHGPSPSDAEWSPHTASAYTLCMHAGAEDRPGQTTGSMVSEVRSGTALHWVTGTAAPCLSIFKPVLLNSPLPQHGPTPTDRYDDRTLWWRHERVHRNALMHDFCTFLREIKSEREALEDEFQARMNEVLDGGSEAERARAVASCWRDALNAEARWLLRLPTALPAIATPYQAAWQAMNDISGLT